MLRSTHVLVAVTALAVSSAASAQLSGKLDEAQQKLNQDIQGCKPISVSEYSDLLKEAAENRQRAAKAAKKGIPTDQSQVDADLAKAASLFAQANAAHAQRCAAQTAGQGQPQDQAKTGPTTSPDPPRPSEEPTLSSLADRLETIRVILKYSYSDNGGAGGSLPEETRSYFHELDEIQTQLEQMIKTAKEAGNNSNFDFDEARKLNDLIEVLGEGWRYLPPIISQQTNPVGQPMVLTPFATDMLAAHNVERAKFGYVLLQWDPGLEVKATLYVNQLAQTGQRMHASRENRDNDRENLSQGLIGWNANQMMASWLNERKFFTPGIFPNVCAGGWSTCGHFTMMIWPTTTHIGCGMATGSGFQWLVCRYSPGGNKDGKPVGTPNPVVQIPESEADGK